MKSFLIIAALINGFPIPKASYEVRGARCHDVATSRAVVESWTEILGPDVAFWCEER